MTMFEATVYGRTQHRRDCRGKRSGSARYRNTEPQSSHCQDSTEGQPDSWHDQEDIRGQIKEQFCSTVQEPSETSLRVLCTGVEAVPATRHKQHRRSTAKDDKDDERGGRGGV